MTRGSEHEKDQLGSWEAQKASDTKEVLFDGSEIRLTSPTSYNMWVNPMIYRGFYTSQVVVWDFWTINSIRSSMIFWIAKEKLNSGLLRWFFTASTVGIHPH